MAIVKISDLPLVDSPVEGTDLFVVVQDNVTKKAYASDIQTYVGFEEIQYATAGQTVFNLTTMTYAAGANNLMVFVDGVNQYEGLSYTETDNNTVTFTQGLHVGAVVKFSTVQTQTSLVNSAGAVTFLQAGAGAVPRSVQSKERDIVSVKDFGAQGDGVTDDTAAIQAAFNAVPQYGNVYFPDGIYITSATLTVPTDNLTIYGSATIKAKNGTNFAAMLSAANRTDVILDGLTFDANKAGRAATQTGAFSGLNFNFSVDCSVINCTVQNTLGFGGASTVAIAASGGATRFTCSNVKFLNCGQSATTLPSDGIFIRGNFCLIENCYASGVTDTAFVLEGCNYSRISNCTIENTTAFAAISNDTSDDIVGNSIDGISGTCNYVGSTGGIIAVSAFGAGNIRQSSVSNVTIRLAPTATNLGPGVQVRKTSSGEVLGLALNNISIWSGGTVGVLAQGFLISNSIDVQINNPFIKMDTSAGSAAIRFDGASNGIVNGGYIEGADYGLQILNSSNVIVQNTILTSQGTYGLTTANSAVLTNNFTRISVPGVAATNRGAGSTLRTVSVPPWASWTPTYSSDIGNAAATFSGAVTTTLARYARIGNTVTITVNYEATLNAVTPAYIAFTLPAGISSVNDDLYTPGNVLNNTTYETGIVRTKDGTDQILVYRANGATYSSAAQVGGRFSITFEIAD